MAEMTDPRSPEQRDEQEEKKAELSAPYPPNEVPEQRDEQALGIPSRGRTEWGSMNATAVVQRSPSPSRRRISPLVGLVAALFAALVLVWVGAGSEDAQAQEQTPKTTVWAWGQDAFGQLGDSPGTVRRTTPVQASGLATAPCGLGATTDAASSVTAPPLIAQPPCRLGASLAYGR